MRESGNEINTEFFSSTPQVLVGNPDQKSAGKRAWVVQTTEASLLGPRAGQRRVSRSWRGRGEHPAHLCY